MQPIGPNERELFSDAEVHQIIMDTERLRSLSAPERAKLDRTMEAKKAELNSLSTKLFGMDLDTYMAERPGRSAFGQSATSRCRHHQPDEKGWDWEENDIIDQVWDSPTAQLLVGGSAAIVALAAAPFIGVGTGLVAAALGLGLVIHGVTELNS